MSNIAIARSSVSNCIPLTEQRAFAAFMQRQVNRLEVGALRYGNANKRKRYMNRIKLELKAYEKTGNMEQLLNIANYCFLESVTPENAKFHFDSGVGSVTRK